jgi:transcriptional regulator with XRE-family HTH domain
LGKRVHELRAAKKWSQEEFAHVSGLHRTYIGQIERGEKNISFANLVKVSSVLGVTLSELLVGLETGHAPEPGPKRKPEAGGRSNDPARRMFEVHKLAKRLQIQRTAMDRTILMLEELATSEVRARKRSRARPPER